MKIAAKLQQGVMMEKIMDNIEDDIADGITHKHLVTKLDIHNIKRQYNIGKITRDAKNLTCACS